MYLGLGESLSTIYCIKYIIFLFLFILNQKLKKKNSTLLNPTSPLLIKIFLLGIEKHFTLSNVIPNNM